MELDDAPATSRQDGTTGTEGEVGSLVTVVSLPGRRAHGRRTPGPKLPTRCSEWYCPGLYQAFKLGGCSHVIPSCTS
jgi:hypothetical protein